MRLNTEKIQNFILKNYRHREFYGYQLQKDLSEEGLKIDITRLYRILNDMSKDDLLAERWMKSKEGPRKKMYKIGEKGVIELNEILLEAIHTVHSFYGDYLLSIRNKIDVFDSILSPIKEKIVTVQNIGFFFKYYTPLIGFYFRKIRETFDAQYYCMKPRDIVAEDYPENVMVLRGDFNDLPLKGNHLDCLILIDLPDEAILLDSVKEWSRILKKDGILSILTPSILLKGELIPMTIGEYVEKTEHTVIEKMSSIDFDQLTYALAANFRNIEINSIVHISTLTCENI
jgi:DNA-binding PadR family transcriptional regulator